MTTLPLIVTADLSSQIMAWFQAAGPLAKYIGAFLIFLIGKFLAKSIGKGIGKAAERSGIDNKLSKYLGGSEMSASNLIGTLVGLVFFLFVLIFALDFAGLKNVTQPLNDLLGGFLNIIPNVVGAGIIGYLTFVLAKVVKTIIQNVLQAARAVSDLE